MQLIVTEKNFSFERVFSGIKYWFGIDADYFAIFHGDINVFSVVGTSGTIDNNQ